jgi:hypothetical protein
MLVVGFFYFLFVFIVGVLVLGQRHTFILAFSHAMLNEYILGWRLCAFSFSQDVL